MAHNLVHHVNAYSYGGWGLYTDEGSSDIVLENNVVYDTKTGGFHQHYGREQRHPQQHLRLLPGDANRRSREDLKNSLTLLHNIVYCDNDQVLTRVWRNGDYHVDYNDYWTTAAAVPLFDGRDFDQWRATSGQDRHSILADPRFVDAGRRNFQLQPGSPALALGFRPIALLGLWALRRAGVDRSAEKGRPRRICAPAHGGSHPDRHRRRLREHARWLEGGECHDVGRGKGSLDPRERRGGRRRQAQPEIRRRRRHGPFLRSAHVL